MSKHSISDGAEREFWKKVRFGAAAAVTLGTGVYAITSALKQQGVVSNLSWVCSKHAKRPLPKSRPKRCNHRPQIAPRRSSSVRC